MEPNLNAQKAALRRQVRAEVERLSPAERALAAARACELLFQQPLWRQARTVLLYAPLPDELDLSPALETALREGKVAALLRYDRARRNYSPFRVSDGRKDLRRGFFGVLEPGPQCPAVPGNQQIGRAHV